MASLIGPQSGHPATAHVGNRQPATVNGTLPTPVPAIPAGTFSPGTKVQVGSHRVVIEKYLSEGGFAHVYLVRLPKPVDGEDGAVLKRVAVPDKEALASMRTEVETMKKLKGHRFIVTYIDSHASQLKGGGYEVFLLMEYCSGGGLIDFMNTRLQNRLTEPEILKIFSDVAQGVASMHYLKPPLLHRDLKVENILISSSGSSRRYKLCDFGSTAPPRPAAATAAEGRIIEDDVQRHTTLQYRSPEMIDVYRKQPIDEKSDIWAMGVLLYKLCYYTTPFEEQGQMAILNASFKFPHYPPFTDRIKKLIASMLMENPRSRPNIYQVVREVCLIRGTDIPIKDIYTGRPASEVRRNQQLPSPPQAISPLAVGAYASPPPVEKTTIPDITPMRRGRPTKDSAEHAPRPNPSPMRVTSSDPFAALDSNPASPPNPLLDDISSRFPPLEQFSILHDTGSKFSFPSKQSSASQPKDISQRVTEALADDAFALPATAKMESLTHSQSVPASLSSLPSTIAPKPVRNSNVDPAPQRPVMVSTGTMTSPSPPPPQEAKSHSSRPIYRFPPSDHRSSSQPRSVQPRFAVSSADEPVLSHRPRIHDQRSDSYLSAASKAPASSRPSLEGQRPSMLDIGDPLGRSKSAKPRTRPVSAYLESDTRFDQELPLRRGADTKLSAPSTNRLSSAFTGESAIDGGEPTQINSNVDFLKAMEEEDPSKKKEKRGSFGSKHGKRSSMPSISLSGTKQLLAGRFGEAFRRFETNTSNTGRDRSPSPGRDTILTPIAGSEATDGRSDDGRVVEETEEAPPEVRRELERIRLEKEEKRVTDAAAAYKQRLAETGGRGGVGERKGGSDGSRAASIQNKVQALLDENGKSSPTKTAAGYGRFTDLPERSNSRQSELTPSIPRTPPPAMNLNSRLQQDAASLSSTSSSVPPNISSKRTPQTRTIPSTSSAIKPTSPLLGQSRPSPAPKPQALRTGSGAGFAPSKPLPTQGTSNLGGIGTTGALAGGIDSPVNSDEWEESFSKRYPNLKGLEMVETDIGNGSGDDPGVREV